MNWPFCLELLLRSGALLAAGIILCRLSRSSTAAFRHRVLVWVFALLAMLPLLVLFAPQIPVSFFSPVPQVKAYVTVQEISSRLLPGSSETTFNWLLLIWASGAFATLLPLLIGIISASRIASRAQPLANPELKKLSRCLASHLLVLVSSELAVPVTCGFLQPRILLPSVSETWSPRRLEAVLLHELAHVRRRDLLAQTVTHVVASLWWFQPLVWIARRRLRAESELACDAEVIRSGLRPSEYSAELLAVARSVTPDFRLYSSAIGMVRPGSLEYRLRAILQPPAIVSTKSRIGLVGLILAGVSLAASAVTSGSEKGGPNMKRTILSALLTTGALSAGTVGGYIHDVSGTPVADAKVSIFNPDNSAKQETVSGADGKFTFAGIGGGQVILRIEKSGFLSILGEFDLTGNSDRNRDYTLSMDSIVAPSDEQAKYIRIGGQVAQSNLITKVQPIYPLAAKKAAVQGTVEIEANISKDGVPTELRVISSPSDDLSESSLEAVRQWRYRPVLLNGNPIEVKTFVVVNYTLAR